MFLNFFFLAAVFAKIVSSVSKKPQLYLLKSTDPFLQPVVLLISILISTKKPDLNILGKVSPGSGGIVRGG